MLDEAELRARAERLVAEVAPKMVAPEEFLGAQFDRGLAFVHFPIGLGGLELAPAQQRTVDEVLHAAGAPDAFMRNVIGYGMGAPTILAHGTQDQQERYLRPLFTGEELWCQLFSEPGAGSDVAGLATRATLDGDQWLVNGQKVWTSLAHQARRGLLAARTDPDLPKHRGLTYFVVDMQAPGVDVRPLFQITGEAEFNEVFLDDLRVPDCDRIGDVGAGWSVILTTLMNERVALGGGAGRRRVGFIDRTIALWRELGIRLTNLRVAGARRAGTPGPEGSVGKMMTAVLNQDISEFAVGLLGAHGMLKPDGYRMDRAPSQAWQDPQQAFLRARANTIEGGTTEIAKNILGERVLGLPGDVRVDKDRPWAQVPRS